jgi:hypothetical protein
MKEPSFISSIKASSQIIILFTGITRIKFDGFISKVIGVSFENPLYYLTDVKMVELIKSYLTGFN